MRRAARTDDNHAAIVSALRGSGFAVIDTSGVGNGFPDLLVGHNRRWILLEVKDGAKSPSRRRKTPDQIKWWDQYAHAGPVALVESVEQALAAVYALEGEV
jgi:Holliday junction resolvase